MHKVPTKRDSRRTRYTWRERAFVFAGIGVAAGATAVSLALGAGLEPAGPFWAAAVGWSVLASVANVLWRGFRLGDWSAFREYEPPELNRDAIDWSTRTGAYAYMRIAEENERLMRGNTY